MNETSTDSDSNSIQVSKYRWVILLIFCLYACINVLQFSQFTIIGTIVKKYYGISIALLFLSSLIFMISTIVFSGLANVVINKFNLKIISLLCIGISTAGALVKFLALAPDRYYMVMIGQFICSLAHVLIMNVPSKLASIWFSADQVSTACSICVFGIQLGFAVGFLLPSMYLENSETASNESITKGLWTMMIVNAIIHGVIFLLVLLFFKVKPKHPPSLSQANLDTSEHASVLKNLKKLFSNLNFILIAVIFALANSCYSFWCITLNDIYGYYFENSIRESGILACISAFLGCSFGNILFGYCLDRFHKFKLTSFIIIFSGTLVYVGFFISMEYRVRWGTYIFYPIFGFFMGTTLLIGLEFGTEATFPLPEVACCSVINSAIYLFTIILVQTIGAFIKEIGYLYVHIILTSLMTLSAALLYFVDATLHRYEANKGI